MDWWNILKEFQKQSRTVGQYVLENATKVFLDQNKFLYSDIKFWLNENPSDCT
jgi:hypothetical protein